MPAPRRAHHYLINPSGARSRRNPVLTIFGNPKRNAEFSRPTQRRISSFIGREVRSGVPVKQAAAIAYSKARRGALKNHGYYGALPYRPAPKRTSQGGGAVMFRDVPVGGRFQLAGGGPTYTKTARMGFHGSDLVYRANRGRRNATTGGRSHYAAAGRALGSAAKSIGTGVYRSGIKYGKKSLAGAGAGLSAGWKAFRAANHPRRETTRRRKNMAARRNSRRNHRHRVRSVRRNRSRVRQNTRARTRRNRPRSRRNYRARANRPHRNRRRRNVRHRARMNSPRRNRRRRNVRHHARRNTHRRRRNTMRTRRRRNVHHRRRRNSHRVHARRRNVHHRRRRNTHRMHHRRRNPFARRRRRNPFTVGGMTQLVVSGLITGGAAVGGYGLVKFLDSLYTFPVLQTTNVPGTTATVGDTLQSTLHATGITIASAMVMRKARPTTFVRELAAGVIAGAWLSVFLDLVRSWTALPASVQGYFGAYPRMSAYPRMGATTGSNLIGPGSLGSRAATVQAAHARYGSYPAMGGASW